VCGMTHIHVRGMTLSYVCYAAFMCAITKNVCDKRIPGERQKPYVYAAKLFLPALTCVTLLIHVCGVYVCIYSAGRNGVAAQSCVILRMHVCGLFMCVCVCVCGMTRSYV